MKDLIIIESPNKASKVAKYSGALVKATVGHFKDLPENDIGVDFENDYKPTFIYSKGKKKVIDEIKKLAKDKRVYIATDPDREGYAIGTFVYEEIKNVAKEILRAEIHEITEKGVKEALKKAVPFEKTNRGLFDAFLGRRVGDRIVGYILSPIASKDLKDKFSVGRVQSPAVRLVVEREREIRNFKPTPYWEIVGVFEKDKTKFSGIYIKGKIEKKEEAEKIYSKIKDKKVAVVKKVERKKTKQKPKPPFTTSDLQITANARFKFPAEKTMKLAQDLFESGLITYHRTDSVRMADEFIQKIRDFVKSEYGDRYVPEKPHRYKSKNTQADAHEAIRPTSMYPFSKIPELIKENKLTGEHQKLLEIIWKRTVASQMASAEFDTTSVVLSIEDVDFKANGRILTFKGFLALYEDYKVEDQILPELKVKDKVDVLKIDLLEKQTKPPARYTEGSLVKTLEKLGIGRPSTYASIMQTIKKRGYVKVEKGKLVPTEKGERLIDYLNQKHSWIIDYDLTKKMEEYLDKVEAGEGKWQSFVKGVHSKMNYFIPDSQNDEPTAKQIAYAEKLSAKLGIELPEDVRKSKKKLSEWIDNAVKKIGNRPISEKQREIVMKYAPDKVKKQLDEEDYVSVRKWLDGFFRKRKSKSHKR